MLDWTLGKKENQKLFRKTGVISLSLRRKQKERKKEKEEGSPVKILSFTFSSFKILIICRKHEQTSQHNKTLHAQIFSDFLFEQNLCYENTFLYLRQFSYPVTLSLLFFLLQLKYLEIPRAQWGPNHLWSSLIIKSFWACMCNAHSSLRLSKWLQ